MTFQKKQITLILLLNLFQTIQSQTLATSYKVYNTGNNYPRPLLLDTNEVMAFSGNPGRMSKYNSYAEPIYIDVPIPEYQPNVAIRQYTNDNDGKNRYIMVDSKDGVMNIYLLNDEGLIKHTKFDGLKVVSYKIDVLLLKDGNLLIGYVTSIGCDSKERCIKVQKYRLKDDNTFEAFGNKIEIGTDNYFISCAQSQSTTSDLIACTYVTPTCKERAMVIKEDLSSYKEYYIYENSYDCAFDKVFWLIDNVFVFTFQQGKKISYSLKKIDNIDSFIDGPYKFDHRGLQDCVSDTMRVDSTKFNETTFIISCVSDGSIAGTQANVAHIDIVTVKNDEIESKQYYTKHQTVNYPFVSKFSGKFISLFYNLDKNSVKSNVFEILFYPSCLDYEAQTIYINSKLNNICLEKYIVEGTGDDTGGTLEVYFPEELNSEDGELRISSSHIKVEKEQTQPLNNIYYYTSAFRYGTITIKYAGKRGDNIGRYCWLIFKVDDCYEGCYSCSQYGDYYHQYCYGCNKDKGYYPVYNKKGEEEAGNINVNCYDSKNKTVLENYFYDSASNSFKNCQPSCKYCINEGSPTEHNCFTCIDNDYMEVKSTDGSTTIGNCYAEDSIPDGLYLDNTDNLIKVCDTSCATCKETSNFCITCSSGYYKIENDDSSTCSNVQPNSNYYLNKVDGMWEKCYTTCATCTIGGDSSNNNCDTCLNENYHKIEIDGIIINNCTNVKPNHYYLDSSGDDGNGLYKKCYVACNECTEGQTESSMHCSGCASGYYPLKDALTECYKDEEQPDNYYLHNDNLQFEHCNEACTRCNAYSNNVHETDCKNKKCTENFGYLIDKESVCILSTITMQYYYLDNSDSSNLLYRKCKLGCLTCIDSLKCTLCDNQNNYYQKWDDKNEGTFDCFYHPDSTATDEEKTKDEAPDYYLHYEVVDDDTQNIYLIKCYENCLTCSTGGDSGNNNCDSCPSDYHPYYNDPKSCVKDPPKYYLNTDNLYYPCHYNCISCEKEGTNTQNNCIECETGLTVQSISGTSYYHCLSLCDDVNKYRRKIDNTCVLCDSEKEFIQGIYCINCKNESSTPYHKLGESNCLNSIPTGYYEKGDDYGTIIKCPDECEECVKCSTCPNEREANCTKCSHLYPYMNENYCYETCYEAYGTTQPYMHNGNCYENCNNFKYLISNSETYKCEYCPNDKKYLEYDTENCVESIPENAIAFNDPDYEFFYKTCYENCQTCSAISINSNDQKCIKCKEGYYLRVDTTNCEEKCHDIYDKYYVKTTDRICVNCARNAYITSMNTLIVKFLDDNECIEKPNDGYYVIDEDTGTIQHCPTNCATCEIQGLLLVCTECRDPYVMDNNICKDSCPNTKYVIIDKKCINCKESGKYNVNGECLDTLPSDYIVTDTDFYYAEQCEENCATCIIDKTKCTSCKSPYFEQYNSIDSSGVVTCNEECGIYLVKDTTNQKCINCKDIEKYFLNGECVIRDENTNTNYYPSEELGEVEYNVLKPCNPNCATCNEGSTSESQNCLSCSGTKGLLNNNCLPSCEPKRVLIDNECKNCKEVRDDRNSPMYKLNDQCIKSSEITSNAMIIDFDFNIVTVCEEPCLSCTINSEGEQICLSCIDGYYLQPDDSYRCLDNCDNFIYTVKDDLTNKCKNCKEYGSYFYNGACVNKEPDYENFYEVTDDPEKAHYGVIEECNSNCQTCSQGEVVTDGIVTEMNCDSCISSLYLLPTKNCVDDCGDLYGIDITDPNNKKCINCKNYYGSLGTQHYKLISDIDTLAAKKCIEAVIPGYYVSDTEYNTLSKCDDSCETCEGTATKCTACAENYIRNPTDSNKCIIPCTTKYWYIDDDNNYQCSDKCDTIVGSRRPYLGGLQCVEYCRDSECVYCSVYEAYYVFDGMCVNRCPKGYNIGEDGYTCTEKPVVEGDCATRLEKLRRDVKIESLNSAANEWIERYRWSYNSLFTKRVDLYIGNNITLHIFKDDNCQYESSIRNGISYVNTTECKKTIMELNNLNSNEVLFVKYDINRTRMVNQVHYNAYNALTGEALDVSICGSEEILYPFNTTGINIKLAKKLFEEYGVDVFNEEDSFFNDNCFRFYDDYQHDVILKDRRNYIFQNVSLCEKNCDYLGYNFETDSIRCKCNQQMTSLAQVKLQTETVFPGEFKKKIYQGSIECIKCYKLVFSWKYTKDNIGTFVFLFFIIFQFVGIIKFAAGSGFNKIYAFLNQFTYHIKETGTNQSLLKSNPPKRNRRETYDTKNNSESNSEDNNNYSNSSYDDEEEENSRSNKSDNIRTINKKNNYTLKSSDMYSDDYSQPAQTYEKRNSKNKMISNKLPILKEKENNSEDSHKNYMIINSENTLIKKEYKPPTDSDVESFDDDEIDYLKLNDAIDFDNRSFIHIFCRLCKKKIIFIKPFSDVSVFEPFPIRITALIFYISWYFVFVCLFYKDKYFGKRFQTRKKLNINYILSHEIGISILSGFLSSIISFLFEYLLNVKSKFVALIRYEKNYDNFLKKTRQAMKTYKTKLILFFIFSGLFMFFFWYYISSFCAVFPKTQSEMVIISIFALIFGIVFQLIFSLIISILRFIGLKCRVNFIYKVSQILL